MTCLEQKSIKFFVSVTALALKGAFFLLPLDGTILNTLQILFFFLVPPCGVSETTNPIFDRILINQKWGSLLLFAFYLVHSVNFVGLQPFISGRNGKFNIFPLF